MVALDGASNYRDFLRDVSGKSVFCFDFRKPIVASRKYNMDNFSRISRTGMFGSNVIDG